MMIGGKGPSTVIDGVHKANQPLICKGKMMVINYGDMDTSVLQVADLTVVPMNIAVADDIAHDNNDLLTHTSNSMNVNTEDLSVHKSLFYYSTKF